MECLNLRHNQLVLSVTGFAFMWGWLVEQYLLPFHFPRQFMAVVTWNVPVSTFERKRGALVVIE